MLPPMKKIAFMLLLLSGIVTTTNAQDLSKMPEKERNEKLLKEAKEIIKIYASSFYGYTDGKYVVELQTYYGPAPAYDIKTEYMITFIEYNKEEESFDYGFAVGVSFRTEDGRPQILWTGNSHGMPIPEKPLTRGEKVEPLFEYKRQPPFHLRIIDGKATTH
jgi:hypothetical protein